MSDTGPGQGAVPDATRAYNMAAQVNIKLPEVEAAAAAVASLSTAIKALESALSAFGNNSWNLADKINRNLKSIGTTATTVSGQISGLTGAVGAVGGSGGRGTVSSAAAVAASSSSSGGGTTAAGGGGSGWVSSAISSATSSVDRVINKNLGAGVSLGSFVGTGGGDGAAGLLKDLALSPLRWMRDRVNTNRDTAIMSSGIMNMAALQQGTGTGNVMSSLGKFPGSIYGTPQDLLSLFSAAPGLGASYGFGGGGGVSRGGVQGTPPGQGVRAAGFFKGIREMQMMNPLASVSDMTTQLGEYAGNTGAQQRSQMATGGAMSMIGAGGRQKSLSEWAESILRWFEGLRPGAKRGKGFDYGELMAQYFPGSNIDAWFNATGVPQNMRDYWWTYALAKANKTQDTTTKGFEIGADPNNVAWQRLRSSSELTRTEFSLAGQMSGQYAQRESSNRWFNELTGQIQKTIIPAISKSIFAWIQYLPDSIEDLLMTGAERGASALVGGGGDVDNGGIGDIGDSYGEMGGNGLSGLHPDMKSKVGAMMKANPKLRVNSGLRDSGLQRKLKDKGFNNVSGKSSAHTRGMAADLGPASQYKWISRNAKKFGLASGINHGEPWHVGMKGDIPGVGDAFTDFIDTFKGFGASPEGMASLITKLLNTMTGSLGKLLGGEDQDAVSFGSDPDDLYRRLAGTSKNFKIGMNPKPPNIFGIGADPFGGTPAALPEWLGGSGSPTNPGTASGWGANQKQWVGTNPSGRGDKYSMVASPDILLGIQSDDPITRGQAVAKALHNAGFSGDVLRNFLKISYRESHWTANAWNSGPLDESGGILQANQLPWTKQGKPAPFTVADAMDPQAAAYIAWDQYKNVSPMNGPGGPNTMKPWTIGGNPLAGIPSEAAGYTEEVLKKTGLGDIEAMKANLSLVGGKSGAGGIAFNNTFNLSVPGYGGGSNGGIDLRRTVTLIADHLEDEMNRRMKRSA